MTDLLMEEELKLEQELKQEARDKCLAVMEEAKRDGKTTSTQIGQKIVNYGFDLYFSAVDEFITKELAPKRGVQPKYRPMLQRLEREVYEDRKNLVSLLCLSAISVCVNVVFSDRKIELNTMSGIIGTTIEREAQAQWFFNQDTSNKTSAETGLRKRVGEYYKEYYLFNKAMKEVATELTGQMPAFSLPEKVLLGGKLIELLIETTGLFECFSIKQERTKHEITRVIPTQRLVDIWNKNEDILLNNVFRSAPMIVKPDDWTSYYDGGYYGELRPHHKLLRLKDLPSTFHSSYMAKLNEADLTDVLSAVNAVQSTPWKINTKVLDVVDSIFEKGLQIAGIPDINPLPDIPRLEGDYTKDELKTHKLKMILRLKKEQRRKSHYLRALAIVRTARKYKKYERIYFPCNMDFRGRIYPIPVFSFQGDDLTKGLILMQDTPPATDEKAEYWFKIAGCEFFGNDKISFTDQIQWVKDNEDKILSVAKCPLGEDMEFWAACDCPFQFLGWCFAYEELLTYKAMHNNSSVGWVCGVPVAFDGTCSGLQHFSAALLDEIGGKAVNLIPADKPQDVYGVVAAKVNEYLNYDSLYGDSDSYQPCKDGKGTYLKYGTKSMARQWLLYGVDRKVTKRSVMTLAYGSKQYGFREQILSDILHPAIEDGKGEMFTASQIALASYMAKLIWQGVSDVVVKAVEAMKYLQEIASIVGSSGSPVTWTTPMGLPVQQTYLEMETDVFRMRFMNTEKRWYIPHLTGNVDKRRQTQGIAPNFIHSMDASHLQWTINRCKRQGINHFSMIHDSYATSPAQADELFHTVRETFVEMYTKHDVLTDFREDVIQVLVGEEARKSTPKPPTKGKLDLNQVLESLYIFH